MKKKLIIITIAVVLVILLFPIPQTYNDGGTVVYQAILYRVVHWHKLNSDYAANNNEPEFLEGIDFDFYPNNFGEIVYQK